MARQYPVFDRDSLEAIQRDHYRLVQTVQNLQRRLSAFRCELDDPGAASKELCRFELDSALTTTMATATGLITNQYGGGVAHSTGAAVTVGNLATGTTNVYLFSGSSGEAGLAFYDSQSTWRIVQMETVAEKKRLCRFILDAALATSTASVAALITNEYGPGTAHASSNMTAYNLETATSGTYLFEGTSGAAGLASYDSSTNWRILQMECPSA